MKISRRAFITSVTASGIALSVSRLALAEEPGFATRETLPGRQAWNPAIFPAGRRIPRTPCSFARRTRRTFMTASTFRA